jgi:exonuclease VII large subunit
VNEAHRKARERMHEAIANERRQGEQRLESTRAHLRTRNRERQQKTALLMLHRGWESLREALASRWRDPQTQKQWCENLLDKALTLLPRGHWNIQHPGGWRPAAAQAFAAKVKEATGHAPTLSPDSDIGIGLRICCGTACLDGTMGDAGAGLLADRLEAEARLLAHLHHILARREGNDSNGR